MRSLFTAPPIFAGRLTAEEAAALPFSERKRLLADNPVLAARLFKIRIDAILRHILHGAAAPLGDLIDYWMRIEFQARGSPHVHAILWALLELAGQVYTGEELAEAMLDEEEGRPLVSSVVEKHVTACIPPEPVCEPCDGPCHCSAGEIASARYLGAGISTTSTVH